MFDPEFIKYLASLGVGGAIAAFVYLYSRKDNEAYTKVLIQVAEERKGQVELLVNIVKEVSTAVASNTKVIEAFHNRLDRLYKFEDTLKDVKNSVQESK